MSIRVKTAQRLEIHASQHMMKEIRQAVWITPEEVAKEDIIISGSMRALAKVKHGEKIEIKTELRAILRRYIDCPERLPFGLTMGDVLKAAAR